MQPSETGLNLFLCWLVVCLQSVYIEQPCDNARQYRVLLWWFHYKRIVYLPSTKKSVKVLDADGTNFMIHFFVQIGQHIGTLKTKLNGEWFEKQTQKI